MGRENVVRMGSLIMRISEKVPGCKSENDRSTPSGRYHPVGASVRVFPAELRMKSTFVAGILEGKMWW